MDYHSRHCGTNLSSLAENSNFGCINNFIISASGKTTAADFPPNSTTAGTALSAAACRIAFPVFTDPVKVIWQHLDEAVRSSASLP